MIKCKDCDHWKDLHNDYGYGECEELLNALCFECDDLEAVVKVETPNNFSCIYGKKGEQRNEQLTNQTKTR